MALTENPRAGYEARDPSRAGTVSPPLHDAPELQPLHDALWSALGDRLRRRGVAAPLRLSRGEPVDWEEALLAQTCAYGYACELEDQVALVATPRYRVRGADGPFLRSVVLVRADDRASGLADLRGARFSHPSSDANSLVLLRAEAALVRSGPFLGEALARDTFITAAEDALAGRSDAALLDAAAYAHIGRLRPALAAGLRPLLWTARAPGPPLVTARRTPPEALDALREALLEIEHDPAVQPVLSELLITGFNPLPKAQYRAVLHFRQIAASQDFADLH